jgi:hypothetical protein
MGMKPRSRKYPIIGLDVANDKGYKYTIASIQKALGIPVTEDEY